MAQVSYSFPWPSLFVQHIPVSSMSRNVDALRQSSRITAHYLGWDQQFDSKQSPAKSSRPGMPSVSDPGCPRIF